MKVITSILIGAMFFLGFVHYLRYLADQDTKRATYWQERFEACASVKGTMDNMGKCTLEQ